MESLTLTVCSIRCRFPLRTGPVEGFGGGRPDQNACLRETDSLAGMPWAGESKKQNHYLQAPEIKSNNQGWKDNRGEKITMLQ